MTLNRTFNNLKFKRTYIGGSLGSKNQMLHDVDEKEDWLEYRNLATKFFDDKLNVILSWKIILNVVRYGMVIISMFFMLLYNINNSSNYLYLAVILFFVSLISNVLFIVFERKLRKWHFNYDLILSHILNEIKKNTGFNLSKNQ
jgi:hypothetical protein